MPKKAIIMVANNKFDDFEHDCCMCVCPQDVSVSVSVCVLVNMASPCDLSGRPQAKSHSRTLRCTTTKGLGKVVARVLFFRFSGSLSLSLLISLILIVWLSFEHGFAIICFCAFFFSQ